MGHKDDQLNQLRHDYDQVIGYRPLQLQRLAQCHSGLLDKSLNGYFKQFMSINGHYFAALDQSINKVSVLVAKFLQWLNNHWDF